MSERRNAVRQEHVLTNRRSKGVNTTVTGNLTEENRTYRMGNTMHRMVTIIVRIVFQRHAPPIPDTMREDGTYAKMGEVKRQ